VQGCHQRESAKCTRYNRQIRPSHNCPVPYTPNAVIPDTWNKVINTPNTVHNMSNKGPELPAVPEPVANESSNSNDNNKYYNRESSESDNDEVVAAIGEGEESGISCEECEE
jgi:L-aminopeptidase/D-esterase-like protein